MALLSLAYSVAMTLRIRRRGSVPAATEVMVYVMIPAYALLYPSTYLLGIIVLSLNLSMVVLTFGRAVAIRLLVTSTPLVAVVGTQALTDSWATATAAYAIAGITAVSIIGFAQEFEHQSNANYRLLLNRLNVIVTEGTADSTRQEYVGDHMVDVAGFSIDDWQNFEFWQSRVHLEDRETFDRSAKLAAHGVSNEASYRLLAENGDVVHIFGFTHISPSERGPDRIRGLLVDATQQQEALAEARQLAKFVHHIPLSLQIFRIDDPKDTSSIRLVDANERACLDYETTVDELLAQWPSKFAIVDTAPGILEAFANVRRTGNPLVHLEHAWIDRDGEDRRIDISAFSLGDSYVGVSYEDITHRSGVEVALRCQARTDALTGLPNRLQLGERMELALRPLAKDIADPTVEGLASDTSGALLMMDLNQFKEVNDALGHHHGDRLLVELSRRLSDISRGATSAEIARLGGDEFAMLIVGCDARGAFEMSQKITEAFAEPVLIDGISLQTNVSIGIALYPKHSTDSEGLMRRADTAMYRAKQGGTGISLFTEEQSTNSMRRFQLIGDLRTAIENAELTVHYHPRVDFSTNRVEGLEALVRWEHPRWGMLPPDEFIALAEVSGFIQDLTGFVIRTAVAQGAELLARGHMLPIAVNLSVRNLYSPTLIDTVLDSLREYQLPAEHLRVEITESELMDDPSMAMQVLQRFRTEGIQVSIDDFGTGYSSLSYLRDLPIDEIKIDRSFVAEMTGGDDILVRSIIDLGHALGTTVVGEGVETVEQWDHLHRLGCDFAQGFLICEPLGFEEMVRFLDDREAFGYHSALGAPVTRG